MSGKTVSVACMIGDWGWIYPGGREGHHQNVTAFLKHDLDGNY